MLKSALLVSLAESLRARRQGPAAHLCRRVVRFTCEDALSIRIVEWQRASAALRRYLCASQLEIEPGDLSSDVCMRRIHK